MTEYRFDAAPLKTWEKTPEGYLNFLAPIACEGWLTYFDKSGEKRREYVSRKTLADSVHTFVQKPVTKLHPEVPVNAANAKDYTVGWTSNGAKLDDRGVLWLQGTVFDADTVSSIESGETREISCGYKVHTQRRGDAWEQVGRVGNHIAAVPKGRAGPEVAFKLDSADDQVFWCRDAIDATDSEITKVSAPPFWEPETKNKKEKKTVKVTLDGLEIEVSTMDEARHVQATDAALRQSRTTNDSLQTKLETVTTGLQQAKSDQAEVAAKVTALTTKLDDATAKYDSLKLDYDDMANNADRGDGAGETPLRADKAAQMISERMALWTQVLPVMRADNPDFKPDFSLDPIGIMAGAVKAANPNLADQLDALDTSTPEAQGMIKGLFLSLDAAKTEVKSRTTVDSFFANVYQTRQDMAIVTTPDARRDSAAQKRRDRIAANAKASWEVAK